MGNGMAGKEGKKKEEKHLKVLGSMVGWVVKCTGNFESKKEPSPAEMEVRSRKQKGLSSQYFLLNFSHLE